MSYYLRQHFPFNSVTRFYSYLLFQSDFVQSLASGWSTTDSSVGILSNSHGILIDFIPHCLLHLIFPHVACNFFLPFQTRVAFFSHCSINRTQTRSIYYLKSSSEGQNCLALSSTVHGRPCPAQGTFCLTARAASCL